jgi:hypothetical protein
MPIPERRNREFERAIWMLENQIKSPDDLQRYWSLFPYRRRS